jgi:tRNA A37 threonylcarbamoyladenosine modification protein TsaB
MIRTFRLKVEKEKSRLALFDDEREIAAKEWPESRDMGRQLFQTIDVLLSERGLKPGDVDHFEVDTDVSDNFTSVKIANIVARTYEFASGRIGNG